MSWPVVFTLLALAAVAAVLVYRRFEPRIRGGALLAMLRWAAAALILLLLFNPVVPRRGAATDRPLVLLDGSLSMGMPGDSGGTAWQQALARAREQRVDHVLIFGGDPLPARLSALGEGPPGARTSLLAPALRIVAEEGARRVLVLSDGRIGDGAEAGRLAREMGIALDVVRLGGGPVDYGLTEMDAPAWAEVGKSLTVRVGVAASGPGVGDTALNVVLKEDGRVVARGSSPAPAEGHVAALALRFKPATAGLVRLEAALSGGDAVADDDHRVMYLRVTSRPAAVLVSLNPDWEPRFLAPALQRALGLPVQGFLHVGGNRYLRLGGGPDAGQRVSVDVVRRAVRDADLLVLHGMDDGAPDWVRGAATGAGRLLLLPDTGAYGSAPVPLNAPAGGEWYLSADVPASPVASLMSGLDVEDLPPLSGPRLLRLPPGWWTPLVLRRGRRGVDAPLLAAGEVDGRRIAVVTAAGTWRWAFTGGGAGTYDRVWAAMAGWLMGQERAANDVAVRPVDRVVARGASPRWVAPGLVSDSLALSIGAPSASVMDTVVPFVRDSATTVALKPGDYMYRARALRHDSVVATASGPFSVASFSADFTAPVLALEGGESATVAPAGSGVPLRAMAWPYALLLLVLIMEWTLRSRWGLR